MPIFSQNGNPKINVIYINFNTNKHLFIKKQKQWFTKQLSAHKTKANKAMIKKNKPQT